MGTLNPDTVDALNMLLEDVRASIEIEVALSNGATEYLEREALSQMGVEDTMIAFLLHDWLDTLDVPVTRRINGIVLQALDLTRYDDRLQLFVHHQLATCEQARHLLDDGKVDGDGQAILRALADAHARVQQIYEVTDTEARLSPYQYQDISRSIQGLDIPHKASFYGRTRNISSLC